MNLGMPERVKEGKKCEACGGSGIDYPFECHTCRGTGKVPYTKDEKLVKDVIE